MTDIHAPFAPDEATNTAAGNSHRDKWTPAEITRQWATAKIEPDLLTETYFAARQCPTPTLGMECRTMRHKSRPSAKEFPALVFPLKTRDGFVKGIHAIRFTPESV